VATRCPRCKEHDLSLETFGVFRCARCGRMTIDGGPVEDGATDAASVVTTGSASFAAPPRIATAAATTREPLPRVVLTLVAIEAILCVVKAMLPGVALARVGIRASALAAILIGNKSGYRYALSALGCVIAVDLMNLGWWWPTLAPRGQAIVALLGVMDVVLGVALLSPAARRHYTAESH
jgi:hypothetical protein